MSARRTAASLIAAFALVIPFAHAQSPQSGTGAVTLAAAHPSFVVSVVGQGRPIVMIPGLASSGTTWDATAAHLAPHFQCYKLTLAGFAGVSPIDSPLLTTARDQIAAYIRDNHLDHPVIMGHSLGGFVALDLAARNPQLVGPVIIVDSLPFFAQAWFQVDTLAAAQPTIDKMRAGMEGLSHEQWVAYTQAGTSTNGMATSPADQKTLIDWGLASDQKTVTNAMLDLVGTDLRPELKSIQTPVLVIGTWIGLKNYGVTEAEVAQEFHQQYAGVRDLRFVMSDTARHFVMWDDPVWFDHQIDDFLAGSPSSLARGTEKAQQ
ncbi:MAG: alpha/beta hydrolase [Acidobacteriaceae bacterium]